MRLEDKGRESESVELGSCGTRERLGRAGEQGRCNDESGCVRVKGWVGSCGGRGRLCKTSGEWSSVRALAP